MTWKGHARWLPATALAATVLHAGEAWEFLKGRAPADGAMYLPAGYHTRYSFNLTNNEMVGIVYGSATAATFINSFGDRAGFLGVTRGLTPENWKFGVEYSAGVVVGYRGRLQEVDGIPFRKSFLFRGGVNPAFAFLFHARLAPRLRAQLMVTPLVLAAGAKYEF